MKYQDSDRAMALAGIYQAASLVQQVARRGMPHSDSFAANIHRCQPGKAKRRLVVPGSREAILETRRAVG
ncbi:MAG: DUF489 family protein, partial [Candidatus Thiodiazotropha sp.]